MNKDYKMAAGGNGLDNETCGVCGGDGRILRNSNLTFCTCPAGERMREIWKALRKPRERERIPGEEG